MKLKILSIFSTICMLFFACGGGNTGSGSSGEAATNEKLGKLPGIAKQYKDDIAKKKQELEECTDQEEAFKLHKEGKLLEKEADKVIEEYVKNNPITNLPFEQNAEYKFTINEVRVEGASDSRINFKAKVTINEDIRLHFGNPPGFAKNFFAYMQAVDKNGKPLTRKKGVMMNSGRSPFKTGMEVEMYGSLDGPADLVDFDKLVFISEEEYKKNKYNK